MSDQMSILEDLAAGRIDAAEAARRIDALKSDSSGGTDTAEQAEQSTPEFEGGRAQFATHTRESFRRDPEPEAEEVPEEPRHADSDQETVVEAEIVEEPAEEQPRPQGTRGVDRVVVRAVGRRVRIIGDRATATVTADGPHVLRRTGKTLEVASDGEIGPSLKGFSILKPPRSLDDLRTLGLGKELLIRVNPAIPVDVEVTGGALTVTDVPVLGRVRVTVGGATLEGVTEVEDALVQTGPAHVTGSINRGRSRIRVESGSLTIELGAESNVTVRGEARLGRVVWPGEAGPLDEYVAGNGSARLDVGVVMGQAIIKDATA
ncbi:hypothetical protein M3G03_04675 [Aestuariimicrobium sp. p3-SID1156]|uniref:hypothetical protein n=1 Tax=Aestuariimicrobium sp. p3-SID1156 TaxID=2916038 RepID=UPI00223B9F85|nr:hypothetical protein [Aestuariimicrobium sp. p3-SID1156]MCT1458837.1 hypothetical protein [Aestuariimicrobium sp. p3-SID1156]